MVKFYFLAHICDNESGTWYKFNDESVEKIDNKKLKFTIEDEYEGNVFDNSNIYYLHLVK